MGNPKKRKKEQKIVKYKRPLNLNVGMIIFAIIFIYLSSYVFTYIKREKIQIYEVVEGGIVKEKRYTGIILREETINYTDRAGYINYYIREGKRASVGSNIYSVDETGSIAAFLAEHPEAGASLSEEHLIDIKKQLSSFSISYQDEKFRSVYDRKYSLDAFVLEYANFNALGDLDGLMEQAGVNFHQVQSSEAGVVSYAIDNLESLDASQISEELFNENSYPKLITKSGEMVPKGSPIYKMISSDDWSVIFPMTEEDIADYGNESSLTVNFEENDLTASADFSMLIGTDGKTYGKLDFHKYMVQFVSDRYVSFEIAAKKVTGLKIPVSAVVSKDFYLIPVEYLAQSEDGTETGFMKEVYSEQGTSLVFVPTVIYYSTEEYYYIDINEKSELKTGDYLAKPTGIYAAEQNIAQDAMGQIMEETNTAVSQAARSAEKDGRFQIGANASLKGVYNINKGYAVFKQIDILSSNEEYYTIRKGVSYGLSVYDHIVLNGGTITEGNQVYQ